MSAARLTQVRLRRFKSIGEEEQTIDLRPLTVLIGRNSSGKSTVIQSLLLLKQTLEDPRPEVQFSLQGNYVRATSLRELTHGWPDDVSHEGPEITLRWTSSSGPRFHARIALWRRNMDQMPQASGTWAGWLLTEGARGWSGRQTTTEVSLALTEVGGIVAPRSIVLRSFWPEREPQRSQMVITWDAGMTPMISWTDGTGNRRIKMDHFIPDIARPSMGERPREEDLLLGSVFDLLYADALRDLQQLLTGLNFIGSSREEIPPYYAKPAGLPSRTMLPGGGNAPELLYGRQAERVHYAALAGVTPDDTFTLPEQVVERSLKEAVTEILAHLGIDSRVSFQDVQELGLFRLLFGRAPLNHVGRGVGHVLPVLVAGLLADPLLGRQLSENPEVPLDEYLKQCPYAACLALEELESHLHPKAQSRLAQVMLALARSGRQLLIETHSDHLVRRLRSLVAHTAPGSESERWLLENVGLVEVTQSPEGATRLNQERLTREGSIERWPADFMDEATDEERAIYFAGTAKSPPEPLPAEEALLRDAPSGDYAPSGDEEPSGDDAPSGDKEP